MGEGGGGVIKKEHYMKQRNMDKKKQGKFKQWVLIVDG